MACRFTDLKTEDLIRLGVPSGEPAKRAYEFIKNYVAAGSETGQLEQEIAAVVANPSAYLGDPQREAFARSLYSPPFEQRETPAPWRQWGSGLEPDSVKQMANACALPVSVAGALMPDAHVGYGCPSAGCLRRTLRRPG
jgi:tRNA-splicing ligase RtcB